MNELILLPIIGALAGLMGVMLGIGGGIIIVPVLTLGFGMTVQQAAATSLITIIANSTIGTMSNIASGFTNIRLGLLISFAGILGSWAGTSVGIQTGQSTLKLLFGVLCIFVGFLMLRKNDEKDPLACTQKHIESPYYATYFDASTGCDAAYAPERVALVVAIALSAGFVSGLLGIGGGIFMVPAMAVVARMPMKAAVATSTFFLGIVAAAGALVYYRSGFVRTDVAALMVLGVFAGSRFASWKLGRVKDRKIQIFFVIFQICMGIYMILREVMK